MRIGFLINPIAGMGGRVGLKGTDDMVEEAIRLGANPIAPEKAAQMLQLLRKRLDDEAQQPEFEWATCSGPMGEDALRAAGFDRIAVLHKTAVTPTARDTAQATGTFLDAGVDLILFCGGDGTARDIASVVGEAVPVLGIPSGVKMYSGVFGMTLARTAEILIGFAQGRLTAERADILDLDEEKYRQGEWAVRLFSSALTPYEATLSPVAKMLIEEASDADVKQDIASDLLEEIRAEPTTLFLLGAGSTVRSIAEALGIEKTLLGIDAVANGDVVGRDLNESGIADLLQRYQRRKLILSPIGAQGFVLGRGNLQLSPDVIRKIGGDTIVVVATPAKLARTPILRFDTGDAALDAELTETGYLSVLIGYRRRRLVKVQS